MSAWIYTDEPADPCAYCVGWRDDPDDEQKSIPISPYGHPVPRLYRGTHERCAAMVRAYHDDHKDDPDVLA